MTAMIGWLRSPDVGNVVTAGCTATAAAVAGGDYGQKMKEKQARKNTATHTPRTNRAA